MSGLPFASLPPPNTVRILEGIEQTLRPGGTFTTFQYVHAYRMKSAVAFREDISRRLGSAPSQTLVPRNFPPAYVLSCRTAGGVVRRPDLQVRQPGSGDPSRLSASRVVWTMGQ